MKIVPFVVEKYDSETCVGGEPGDTQEMNRDSTAELSRFKYGK